MGTAASQSLISSVRELSAVVKDLKGELVKSNNKYDDLEQYTRRNSIRISGIPENPTSNAENVENVVCETLNKYIQSPVSPTEIDRCHRIFRPNTADKSKPCEIIVKFVSHKSMSSILSKVPMEKLRNDNNSRPMSDRIYISKDLTRVPGRILFRTRKLKRQKRIKDTFSRDGRIIVKTLGVNGRIFSVTTEDELELICSKHNIRLDPLDDRSGSQSAGSRVSPMETQQSASPGDDIYPPGLAGPMATAVGGSLDPNAEAFDPSQSLLQSK